MSEVPMVSCLCPTYHRPQLLANAIACFQAQDYPAHRRELIILDDTGLLGHQSGPGWQLLSLPRRFASLPEKFNALAGLASGELLVVWEDDDVYLPWHLTAHSQALEQTDVSKPSAVLSLFSGRVKQENAARRFHASLAFHRQALYRCGGWPLTRRADFDRHFIEALCTTLSVGDPCETAPPSYVFRWQSTGAYHGQQFMHSPEDEQWYARCQITESTARDGPIVPQMDLETRHLYATLAAGEWSKCVGVARDTAQSHRPE